MLEFLNNIPKRPEKPRTKGLTMIMDKGLSLNEATFSTSIFFYFLFLYFKPILVLKKL